VRKFDDLISVLGGGLVKRKVESIVDEVRNQLQSLESLTDAQKNELKKRKLVQEAVIKAYDLAKGANFSLTITKQEAELTADMLTSGAWKNKTFKVID
jgi:phenylalanyl-tRNA synthetase alpha chain